MARDSARREGGPPREEPPQSNASDVANSTTESELRQHLGLLLAPGGVLEVRILKRKERPGSDRLFTASGYFTADGLDRAVAAILREDEGGLAPAIYATLNPVNPALLARANNRLVLKAASTTSDADVVARRWVLIDCDPVRPANLSSTDAELGLAEEKATSIREYLTSRGWPDPVEVMSGNGRHLLYRVDLPADDHGLVERLLKSLAARFDDDRVKIDTAVHNAARITKLAGTMSRKGEDFRGVAGMEDRPHRRAKLVGCPTEPQVVPADLIEAECRSDHPPKSAPGSSAPRVAAQPDGFEVVPATPDGVEAYLKRHGVSVACKRKKGTTTFIDLTMCPVSGAEASGNEISVIVGDDGSIAYKNHHNRGAGVSWTDVREKFEPGFRAAAGTSVGSVSPPPGPLPNSWVEPIPLPAALPPVEPFTPDLLPEALRPWIVDIADRVQCPIDFPAVAAMVSLSALIGRKVGIRPKRRDDWLVVPNLWGGVIGRPGVMKTPAMQEPLKFLRHMEVAAKEAYDRAVKDAEAAELVSKARQKQAEQEIREAVKKQRQDAIDIALRALGEDFEKPVRKRYVVNDSTVEKLGELLNQNPTGFLVFRDELIGLLKSLDKEGQEGARSFYLEAWNGTGRYTYDRVQRGTLDIEAAILSVLGGIQPGPLSQYLRGAAREGAGDDGLIQRFQLLVWPDISRAWQNVDRWPDSAARARARQVFEGLDRLDATLLGADHDLNDPDGVAFLRFSDEAQALFDQWRAGLEARVRSGDLHPAMESHLSKFRSLIPSLALIIHVADGHRGPVGAEPLRRAIAWDGYLSSHAARIYAQAIHPDIPAARSLGLKLLAGEVKDGFTLREVYRRGWSGLSSAEDARGGAELLVDFGWLQEVRQATPGRTGSWYFVNPRLAGSEASKTLVPPSRGTDRTDGSPTIPPSVGSVSSPGEPFADLRPGSDPGAPPADPDGKEGEWTR